MDIVERLREALVLDPTYGPSIRLSLDYDDIKEAADHIEALREALEFYADVSKYPAPLTGGMGDLWEDCGGIARRALAKGESQ